MAVSGSAHAGALAFEVSSGNARLIVNCGVAEGEEWRRLARTTAAHSTLSLGDSSSARILAGGRFARWLGNPVVSGPLQVQAKRSQGHEGTTLAAGHDGYVAGYGYRHERTLLLAPDGFRIEGQDRLVPVRRQRPRADRFAIRFHLHPAVQATRDTEGVLLHVPGGETWRFASPELGPALEESIYLCDVHGRRRTRQIVLAGRAGATPEVTWSLARESRRPSAAEPPVG